MYSTLCVLFLNKYASSYINLTPQQTESVPDYHVGVGFLEEVTCETPGSPVMALHQAGLRPGSVKLWVQMIPNFLLYLGKMGFPGLSFFEPPPNIPNSEWLPLPSKSQPALDPHLRPFAQSLSWRSWPPNSQSPPLPRPGSQVRRPQAFQRVWLTQCFIKT